MNSNLQFDLHPDADSLNAFAEQSLGKAEREQILAHMTRCSRCRQVIYLAQKAAEAEAPVTQPALLSRGWRWGWRLGWVPTAALAAALAATLTVVVTLHPRRNAPAPEMAKVLPQNAQAAPALGEPPAGEALKPASPVAANSVAESKKLTALRRPPEELALEAAPSAARAPGEINAPPSSSMQSIQMRTQQEFPSQFNPGPTADAWQQRQRMTGTLSAGANTAQASQESMKTAMDRAQASRSVPAFAAVSHKSMQAAPTARFDNGTQDAIGGSTAPRNANLPALPSGLTAISTETVGQRMLAIDVAGALFLSEDAGKHWQPVARQWTGRAVKVSVQVREGGEVFQLTNMSGFSWTSADGRSWTVQ